MMRIESIAALEGRADRFAVLFEGGAKMVVSVTQIADFGLYSGREFSEEEYSALREAVERGSSRARAIRILGSRNLSKSEMERRLMSRGEARETARSTTSWLEDIGAINDGEYAETIVRHYSAKGYGISRIRHELHRRGIPREMWDEALTRLGSMDDAAYDFIVSKLRGSRDKTELRRATDALCRRGFSYEEARAAVSRYIENVDENEGS